MPRAPLVFCFLSLALLSRPARACECETSFSSCHEVDASDLVFIGMVQSIEPIFMNRWNQTNESSMRSLNDAYTGAQQHFSSGSLAKLKDMYLNVFPDSSADEKRRLQAAVTIQDVSSLFDSRMDRGMRVRLKVKTLFKQEEDDDDAPKNRVAKKAPDFFDVWTASGDCGFDFQIGETYLVYANDDEFGNNLSTGSCTRTRRLSDAGEDLAYLFFYKDRPEESARLEGFTTTGRVDSDPLHDPANVKSPIAGVIVELQSDRLIRYAESDANGRFLFDGLPEGDYRVSAFARGYPLNSQLLGGPTALHIQAKSCNRQILQLPEKTSN